MPWDCWPERWAARSWERRIRCVRGMVVLSLRDDVDDRWLGRLWGAGNVGATGVDSLMGLDSMDWDVDLEERRERDRERERLREKEGTRDGVEVDEERDKEGCGRDIDDDLEIFGVLNDIALESEVVLDRPGVRGPTRVDIRDDVRDNRGEFIQDVPIIDTVSHSGRMISFLSSN